MKTLRIFATVEHARAAGFGGHRLYDPDQPTVFAHAMTLNHDRVRGREFDRVLIDDNVHLSPGERALFLSRVRLPA